MCQFILLIKSGTAHSIFPENFGTTILLFLVLHCTNPSWYKCPWKNVDDVITKLCNEKTQLENVGYVLLYFRSVGSSVETNFDTFFFPYC